MMERARAELALWLRQVKHEFDGDEAVCLTHKEIDKIIKILEVE